MEGIWVAPFWMQDIKLDSEFLGTVSLAGHVAASLARPSWQKGWRQWRHAAWVRDEAASPPCLLLLSFSFLVLFPL